MAYKKGTKLRGKAKQDFLRRMNRSKRTSVTRRRRNPDQKQPGLKQTMSARRRRRKPARRRKNPALTDTKIAGVKVADVVRTGLGVLAGAYVGGSVTSFLTNQLVTRFGTGRGAQAAGFFLGGSALIWAGDVLQRKAKGLPVQSAFAAMSAPMFFRALEAAGVTPMGAPAIAPPPAPAPPPPETTATGGFGAQIGMTGGMNGGLAVNPGPYPGALAPGWSPEMRGGFGAMLP